MLFFFFFALSEAAMCPGTVLTDDNRNEFLSTQNAYRSQVALGGFQVQGVSRPTATNMQSLNWDCNLESTAQTYASTCPTQTSGQGQNLYTSVSSSQPSIQGQGTACADDWANQFQTNGWPSSIYSSSDPTVSGSQMCWATTTRVGCGVANCPSSDYRNPYQTTVVCNYSPPGNTPGASIYQEGTLCSDCPYGSDPTTGLCSSNPPAPAAQPPSVYGQVPAAQPVAPVYPPSNFGQAPPAQPVVPVYPAVQPVAPAYPPRTYGEDDDEEGDDHRGDGKEHKKHGKKPKKNNKRRHDD